MSRSEFECTQTRTPMQQPKYFGEKKSHGGHDESKSHSQPEPKLEIITGLIISTGRLIISTALHKQ